MSGDDDDDDDDDARPSQKWTMLAATNLLVAKDVDLTIVTILCLTITVSDRH